MTVEEAIARIKEHTSIHCKKEQPYAMHISEALNKAIIALSKQIPKKIRVDSEGWYCCPKCDETFKLLDKFGKRNKYCGACGQALDWSDNE